MNPLSFNLSEWAINNRSLVSYFMAVCIVAGIWSYFELGRNEDPSFTYKFMVVEAYWPGATIEDMGKQVTERIEKKVQEVPYLDFVRSYTNAGRSTILVVLEDRTPAKMVPDIWYQVRKKVGDIRNSLPQGVIGPGFNDEYGNIFGIIYGFTADGFTHRELRDYVEKVRSRLLQIRDVATIEIIGAQDERIYIEFSSQQLSDQHLDRGALIRSLQEQNAVTPSGVVNSDTEKTMIHVPGGFSSEEDLRRVNFAMNGRLVRMADIAIITRGYSDPPQPTFRANGVPAIGLAISMRDGGDILAVGRDVRHAMTEIKETLPIGIEPHVVADQPEVVAHAVDEFTIALWEAIAIVMAVSLLSLGLRAGTVVALSIPLVLAAVFVVMDVVGISLQRVSLGALIISLGLLVDDAMITVESMVTKLEEGLGKAAAAIYAYDNTHFPMGTGTIVTILAFIPIGLAQSTAGEYTFSLFAVVAISLVISWFVAAIFAPLIGMVLLSDRPGSGHSAGPGRMARSFRRILIFAMQARWLTIVVALAMLAAAMAGMIYIPQQFFPASDRMELVIDLKLPQNSSIYATQRAAEEFDRAISNDADVARWSTYVGRGAVHFYLPMLVELPNDFFVQSVVVAKDLKARERVRKRLEIMLPETFPSIVARVYPLELGPPVGWPLQYRVSGPDPSRVREIAYDVAKVLAEGPGVRSITFDWIETAKNLQIKLDQDQAKALGVSSQSLAESLNAVMSGVNITQIRDNNYLIDVIVRSGDDERLSLATVNSLHINLPGDRVVPVGQIAATTYGQELPLIWRRDRLPTLTVQSDVAPGAQADTVVRALRTKFADLKAQLPLEYHVDVGGTVEESAKAQRSVLSVVPIMLILILTILMIQLHSFQRLFLVISVIPFGLIGVVIALLLANKPFGFIALLGVVALIGMIVRNSVILIIQIEAEIKRGAHPWDAVIEATMHRFRPILLTATAAILGMIPIAPTVFWSPMAYAIMGGLAVATLLTLLFVPALYVIWFRVHGPGSNPNAATGAVAS
ncbi:MAG: efflux RND transporter permease subunit [Xanthobacteraceae bacterium]